MKKRGRRRAGARERDLENVKYYYNKPGMAGSTKVSMPDTIYMISCGNLFQNRDTTVVAMNPDTGATRQLFSTPYKCWFTNDWSEMFYSSFANALIFIHNTGGILDCGANIIIYSLDQMRIVNTYNQHMLCPRQVLGVSDVSNTFYYWSNIADNYATSEIQAFDFMKNMVTMNVSFPSGFSGAGTPCSVSASCSFSPGS